MLLSGHHHFLLPMAQVARALTCVFQRQVVRCRTNKIYCCWRDNEHHALFRTTWSYSTWQHRKRQHECRYFHHDPFIIARMTGGTVHIPPVSPSGITPIPLWSLPDTTFKECHVRLYSTKSPNQPSTPVDENHNETEKLKSSRSKINTTVKVEDKPEKKLGLVQKLKLMYKQYWYVLIPVHTITSLIWYGSFFIVAKSGFDIVPWLEWMGAGESIIGHFRISNVGYYAIAYAMYKIATPARYTVTLGGTTLSINYLKKRGYIKPVPSSEQLKEMYEGKKEEFYEKREEMRELYQERREEMVEKYQEKREEFRDKVSEKKDEFRDRVTEKRDEYRDKMEEGREKLGNLKDKYWKGR